MTFKGQHLALQLKVQDGKFRGRILFVRLNLINKNQDAVNIANNELAEICRVCGKQSIKDSKELHGLDFFVQVKVVEETDMNPAGNEITKYVHKNEPAKSDRRTIFG